MKLLKVKSILNGYLQTEDLKKLEGDLENKWLQKLKEERCRVEKEFAVREKELKEQFENEKNHWEKEVENSQKELQKDKVSITIHTRHTVSVQAILRVISWHCKLVYNCGCPFEFENGNESVISSVFHTKILGGEPGTND